MKKEDIEKRLNEVRAMDLPHMTYEKLKANIGIPWGFEETEENIALMDKYLYKFLDLDNKFIGNGCWLCGRRPVILSWGLTHGVSFSDCCELQYVQFHYPSDVCKEKRLFRDRFVMGLQYHPDSFEITEDDEDWDSDDDEKLAQTVMKELVLGGNETFFDDVKFGEAEKE